MPQSTIKSIEPKLFNGKHSTWTAGSGKVMYDFIVKFEDGTEGECSSIKIEGTYKTGDAVIYSTTSNTRAHNGTKVKIDKKADPPAGYSNGNGRTYNDPVVVQKIAFSICQTIAVKHCELTGFPVKELTTINALAEFYFRWVMSGVPAGDPQLRDKASRRYYALQLAVDCIKFDSLFPNVDFQKGETVRKETVIQMAEEFLGPLDLIGNEA